MSKAMKVIDDSDRKSAVALPAATTSESAALISMIERAARDPAVDITKMERLFEMHQKVMNREAESAFNAAMAMAQAELIPVVKNKTNSQTHSKYADLSAIAEAAMPIIHSHGFGLSFSEFKSDKPEHLGVACEVTHAGGHGKRYEFNVPFDGAGLKGNANKTATHAYGSSFQYGRRYATCGVFNIATKDDDGNAAGAKPMAALTDKQRATLKELIEQTEADLTLFCAAYKVEYDASEMKLEDALAAFPAESFEDAEAKLRQKAKSKC